ncbi:MAG: hypothetical protein JSS77_15920 [Acidobacteria bacterium]|nr:hypothetical protein [Acidobacteriota bacterium]
MIQERPNYLTKAQVVRALGLQAYYLLAPLLRRAKVRTHLFHGTRMIHRLDLPAILAALQETK